MASKSIVADLNKGEKLDGDNYDIWHRKIQYILVEQDLVETLTHTMEEPPEGSSAQARRDHDAYLNWRKSDRVARITLLSSMSNDLIGEFEVYGSAKEMWEALRLKFGATSLTRLRGLTMKFDSYKKEPKHTMKQHLRLMSSMIRELRAAGHVLTEEQQVQAVIRSLPQSWEHMRANMTHNENVKTFDDISRHLELEDERLMADRSNGTLYVAESSSRAATGGKRKRSGGPQNGRGPGPAPKRGKNVKRKRGQRGGKRDKSKMACHNCGKLGHFARECTEPKKVLTNLVSRIYVTTSVYVAESSPLWIVDSGATDHIARDRGGFVEYRRVPAGSRRVYLGDDSSVAVHGIGTYMLEMRGGRRFYLHDVLYAPDIRQNLFSVLVMLSLGFRFEFEHNWVKFFLDSVYYGCGFITNGFMFLDTIVSHVKDGLS